MKNAFLFCLLTAVVLAGCSRPSFDPAAERAALPNRDAEWSSAASAGRDVDKIASYWADDAVIVPPGQPIAEGKAAIRSYVSKSLEIPGFRIHWASETVSFSPDGQLAAA